MDSSAELEKARQSFNDGDYKAARRHLNAARAGGVISPAIQEIEHRIEFAESLKHRSSHHFTVAALCVAAVGYFLLSLRQPGQWSTPVWIGIGFGLLPAVQGVMLGWGAHPEYTRGQRFRNGWVLGAAMMGAYTGFSLTFLNAKIASHAVAHDIPLVILTVTLVFGAIAGLVCGLVSASFRVKEAP